MGGIGGLNVCGKNLLALGELVVVEELGDLFNNSWFFLRILTCLLVSNRQCKINKKKDGESGSKPNH